jgi:uncharacterized protein YndB with AHSA1/START domain
MTAAAPAQVYQLYIKASPEQLWEAITTSEFRSKYFHGSRVESTFKPGAAIRSWSPDHSEMWGDNVILESDPPRRLVHTWRSLYDPDLAAEQDSRVSWEIEPQDGGYCRLTLVHDQLDGAPKTAKNVSGGWTLILCGLKTVVETGEPLSPALAGMQTPAAH